jgi:hypothetical protein
VINDSNIGGMVGAPVHGPDDRKIGTVGKVFLDPDTGMPNWITVQTGLFGRRASFVPLDGATWDNEVIRVAIPKETIKDAPHIDADEPLTPEDETELYRYYAKQTTDATPADGEMAATADATADDVPASGQSRLRKYERPGPEAVTTDTGNIGSAPHADPVERTEFVESPDPLERTDTVGRTGIVEHEDAPQPTSPADTGAEADTAARAIPRSDEAAQPHGRHVRRD